MFTMLRGVCQEEIQWVAIERNELRTADPAFGLWRYEMIVCLLAIMLTTLVSACEASPRSVIDLDGPWSFATDPGDAGEAEQWYLPGKQLPPMPLPGYAPEADGVIQVPGIWDNQGYGTETDKLRHNFVGKGWYKRQVKVPRGWGAGRVFLCIGGVHRYAKTWINGHYLGEHIGFLSEFEYDITDCIIPGGNATIVIQVDCRQRWDVDAMIGSMNLADFMMVEWGGIWGHVKLESRARAWLSELFVRPRISDSACTASATLNGMPNTANGLRLDVFDRAGKKVARTTIGLGSQAPASAVSAEVIIPDAQLWSPDHPYLYTAELSLMDGKKVVDSISTRFGMREIRIDGPWILLNGKRVMLHGYGDDNIYPEEMAMSVDKELHLRRLRTIKSYGFNHVRLHSSIMPPEYYEACDEVGIMPTAEFPIAYSLFLPGTGDYWKERVPKDTSPRECNETYKREFEAAIKRHRNHPSIICWVMGNEFWNGVPLRHHFSSIARRLDPTRPFADSDGLFGGVLDPANDRDTLDIHFLMFDVWHSPLEDPDMFKTPVPRKPIVSHENSNYVTFSRPDLIDQFRHNIKPYWLPTGKEKLLKLGLMDEATMWAEKSERLFMLLQKINIETLRKNPYISGYHWWLIQDYWTSSNGILDTYFRPKSIAPEEVLKINGDLVILQDGLASTYRGGGKLDARLKVSNFLPDAIVGAEFAWKVLVDNKPLAEGRRAVAAEQGTLVEADRIVLELPDVTRPTSVRIETALAANGREFTNDWTTRLFPKAMSGPSANSSVPVYADETAAPLVAGLGAKPMPKDGSLAQQAVYVVGSLHKRVIDAASQGACVVMVDGAGELLATRPKTFRTSWWKAGHNGGLEHLPVSYEANDCGTVVYDHPITRQMAPDGWCDDGWYSLVDESKALVLEDAPCRPNVIIRALPGFAAVEDKALLFEVGLGEGSLIVSGLNHRKAAATPEGEWLLAKLIEHAAGFPKPDAKWPVSYLFKTSGGAGQAMR